MVDRTAKGDRSAIAAVLFDLDGTLADTAPDLGAALNRVRRDRGLDPFHSRSFAPMRRMAHAELIGAGMSVAPGEPAYDELRDAFLAHYAAALCVDSALFADMGDVLDALDARALPWGIVTNKATRYTAPLLVSLQLSPRAAAVVCGDTTPFAKPHPAPLIEAANRLGVAPERCVYVGDARRDIDAGNAAGMRTLVARWGYLEPGDTPGEWAADAVLDAPGALLGWLDDGPRR